MAWATLAFSAAAGATSRCPAGTESRPTLGLTLALAGVLLAIGLPWSGVLGARLGPSWGRLARLSVDVGAGFLCLAAGALAFAYFALRCSLPS
jgi:hypothetical protein